MKLYKLLLITFLISSCAQISNPSGGPKDITGPKVVKLSPNNQSVNFINSKIIEIQLNEYIKLNNLNKELIISPPILPKPNITHKGKIVKIDLSESKLNNNTTYSINFGQAIVDFNEGNPLRNFTYVFSTGNTIDSLSLSGSIINIETGKLGINTSVMLYKNTTDTFLKTKPNYLTRTDSFGNYTFYNLPSSEFKLYALEDKNSNREFDDGEYIAYQTKLVNSLNINSLNPVLNLFKPIYYPKLIIRDTIKDNQNIKLIFNKNINKEYFTLTNKSQLYKNYNIIKDTLILYNTTLSSKKNNITVTYLDSNIFVASLGINPKNNLKSQASFTNINRLHENDTLEIKFSSPIYTSTSSYLSILKDSVKQRFSIKQIDESTFHLTSSFKEDNNYTLIYNSKFIGDTIETLDTFNLYINPNDRYGSIICTIKNDSNINLENYLIQLSKNKVITTIKPITKNPVIFNYLREGDYRIKLIEDLNKDGNWTKGDLRLKTQPEPIKHFDMVINVKSNWDIDVEIKLP